jgi:hypothetical protein
MIIPVSVDAVVGPVMTIARSLLSAIKQRRDLAVSVAGARKALALDRTQLGVAGFRRQSLHPIYSSDNRPHPDELAGLAGLLQDDLRRARREGRLEISDQVTGHIGQSLLLVCGPAWEAVTRLVFGYDAYLHPGRAGTAPESLARYLPYRFDIDADGIPTESARFVRDQNGCTVEREPNWGVIGPRGRRLYPMLGHDGFLHTDYLLITKVPNFLAHPSAGSEHFIVNVAGTHGIGQRATDALLANGSVIRKTAQLLAIDPEVVGTWPEAYQALFRVGGITHDRRRGSRAGDITLVDAVRVDESPEWWLAWRERVRQPLADWAEPPS